MLSSPVGVVTDLDGTVVFGGVADPRLAPFLRRAAGCEDISVIVATSRAAPRNGRGTGGRRDLPGRLGLPQRGSLAPRRQGEALTP